MGLTAIFKNGAKTAFDAVGDLVKDCIYTVITDDGFDAVTEVEHVCTILPSEDAQKEQNPYGFTEMIQPNDVIGFVPGIDLAEGVEMTIGNTVTFDNKTMTIKERKVDPAKALWILLLRAL